MTDGPSEAPLIHVLISEPFFWAKVEGTLRALERRPVRPDWDLPVAEQIAAEPGAGVVLDLECDRVLGVEVLRELRRDPRTKDLPVLAYCSHLRQDLIRSSRRLGVEVVPRSTFAATMVRLLQDLGGSPGDGA